MNMKTILRFFGALLSLTAFSLLASDGHDHGSADGKSAKAVPGYPLDSCLVSGEKLGSMGKPYEYVYKEEGKPDRTVYFCCKMCVSKFKKDPAKYLKALDEAEAANKASK